MKVDVVCLLYQATEYIDGFLQRLKGQKGVELANVVFPITEGDNDDVIIKKIEEFGGVWFKVKKEEFSHSLVRENAIFNYCKSDVVIMMSQDVVLEDERSIFNLAKEINAETVFAYGRQICKKKTIEYYVRKKNYPDKSHVATKDDIEKMQLKTFFSSDAFSAYHRPTFLKVNGYDNVHMMMSEDMYYAKKIIDLGYKKAYVAEAVVEHSHKFTLKQLYDRYYATGVWFAEHKEFDGYKTTDSGLKLAINVFFNALKHFNIPVLVRFVPDMTARFLGMKKGKKSLKQK